MSCMVVGCGSTGIRDKLGFYRIPSKFNNKGKMCNLLQERREKWIAALRRADLSEEKLKYGRICSKHFITGKPAKFSEKNHPDWVPTQMMGYKTRTGPPSLILDRCHRAKNREIKKQVEVLSIHSIHETETGENNNKLNSEVNPENKNHENLVNEKRMEVNVEQLDLALRECNSELYEVRAKLNSLQFNEAYFENSDKNTLYYTGLPSYIYVRCIYNAIEEYLTTTHSSTLTKFQQLILTLIKLRLNLPFRDLGNRFGCHHTTVARIFIKVLDILYYRFKSLISWPDREDLKRNIPLCFKENFKSVTAIIDCFEIFIEKSTNLDAAAKTWSNYKHHHTLKFLIGITPHGQISFISNAYGGRASDKFITEDSGFLDKLIPGDVILADRGFLIHDSVKYHCAEVITPAYKKGKNQLLGREIEDTRKLASVRIHVERIIGVLKQKYTILSNKLPLVLVKKKSEDEFAFIDKVVVVCCSLVNLCPSIIPLHYE